MLALMGASLAITAILAIIIYTGAKEDSVRH